MRLICFLWIVSCLSFSKGSKLNLPRVLLPIFNGFSTNYTLEVTGFGCYKWSSSRGEVVEVKGLDGSIKSRGCSQRAVVSCVTGRGVSSRTMAIVLAEEVTTGQVFRADIIVDHIASLHVATTTRTLYMEEPPEMFQVTAYDKEGNEFTTLEGVELEWKATKRGGSSGEDVVRFMLFRESTYETPHQVAAFDSAGKQGHMVLLEAIRTGRTTVSVRLPHLEYSNVPPVEVIISVIPNIIIDPSDVYILPGDSISFRILQVREGRLIEVKSSSTPQYQLISEDSSVLEMSGRAGRGLRLGHVEVILKEQGTGDTQDKDNLPRSRVNVVDPDYISLSILPHNNWALFTNQPASLYTDVYDREKHKVTLGEGARVEIRLDEGVFPVTKRSRNGSWLEGNSGPVPAVTEVRSHLYRSGGSSDWDHDSSTPLLKTTATLHIFPPLILHPPIVAFPYHHHSTWSEVEMRVEGGDGINMWSILNRSVAAVSQSGVVKPIGEGETKVEVAMVRNPHLKATSSVLVLHPHAIEILSGVREAETGTHIHLDIALYGLTKHGVRVPFTDCSRVSLVVSLSDAMSFEHDRSITKQPTGDACTVVSLLAKVEAKSKVLVSFLNNAGVTVEAETWVGSYGPLVAIHPLNRPAVLAPRSSRHVVFTGGPRPWFGRVVPAPQVSDPSVVKVSVHKEAQELYVYNVVCLKVGVSEVSATVVTEPYSSEAVGVSVTSSVKVLCSKPRHIELSIDFVGELCPIDRALAVLHSNLRLRILLRDQEGRPFDNATSLQYKWFWGSNDKLLSLVKGDTVDLEKEVTPDYVLPRYHYKDLIAESQVGSTTVKLKAIGLLHDKQSTDFKAEGSIIVEVVEAVRSEPETLSIVSGSGMSSKVKLLYGSGRFQVDEVGGINVEMDGRTLSISPQNDGTVDVIVRDVCLPGSSVIIPVSVVSVASVRVEVSSRMEVGRQTTAVVKLYDSLDRELSLEGQGLTVDCSPQGIISLSAVGPRSFLVKANHVGTTSVTASFNNLSSPPAHIQVFTAIKLSPRNLTLLVGAEYQVRVTGGPGPDLRFTSSDSTITSVSSTGLITAHHTGESWISVSTVGGEGKDSVAVTVLPLSGVMVSGPTSLLVVGGRAPLWAQPLPQAVSPLVLASVTPSFTYTWTSSLPGVAHLVDRYASADVHVTDEDRLSMEVRGVKAGRTVIYLRLSGGTVHHGVYEASIEVTVVDRLAFTRPSSSHPPHPLLIHPHTRFTVQTNLEDAKLRVVSLVGDEDSGSETNEDVQLSPVISLRNDGGIMSHSSGLAVLTASLPRTSRTTVISLQVTPVVFMMVNVGNSLNGSGLAALPRGLDLLLNVTYHDTYGREFYASPSHVSLRLNRHDKTVKRSGGTNSSFVMVLEGKGVTVVQASDSISPLATDFLRIPADDHIVPTRREMTVGEVVCFNSKVVSWTDEQVEWTTEGDAVRIEGGVARAVQPGSTVITYRRPSQLATLHTSLNIQVNPLHSVAFGGSVTLSNAEVGKEYLVAVNLLSQGRGGAGNARDRHVGSVGHTACANHVDIGNFPFACQMRFNSLSVPHPVSSVFSVQPTFDKTSGGFACAVRVVGGISPNTSVIQSNVTLRVTVNNGEGSMAGSGSPHHQDSVVLEFHPAVFLATPHLSLPNPSSVAQLLILATPHVAQYIVVEASDRTMLKVGEIERRGVVSWAWPIHLHRDHWLSHRLNDLHLVVLSPLTNQTLKVGVNTPGSIGMSRSCVYQDGSSWSAGDLVPSATTSIFIALVAIVVFFMASNYCYSQMNRNQMTSPPQRFSPVHPSHATLQEYSLGSRTPSPMTHRPIIYGSPDNSSPGDITSSPKSAPRLRRLYQ